MEKEEKQLEFDFTEKECNGNCKCNGNCSKEKEEKKEEKKKPR